MSVSLEFSPRLFSVCVGETIFCLLVPVCEAVVGFSWWVYVVFGIVFLGSLVVKVNGFHWFVWVKIVVEFLLRFRSRNLLSFRFCRAQVSGAEVGVAVNGDVVLSMVAIEPRNDFIFISTGEEIIGEDKIPLPILSESMHQFGYELSGIDIFLTVTPTSQTLYQDFPDSSIMISDRVTYLVVRASEKNNAMSIFRHGGGEEGKVLSHAGATLRLVHRLCEAGVRARTLGAKEIQGIVKHSVSYCDNAREEWSFMRTPGQGYDTSYIVSADHIADRMHQYLTVEPALEITQVLRLEPGSISSQLSMLVRYKSVRPVIDPFPGLIHFSGKQKEGLLATLPLGWTVSDVGLPTISSENATMVIPCGARKQFFGVTVENNPVYLSLVDDFKQFVTVWDGVEQDLALILFRAISVGFRVAIDSRLFFWERFVAMFDQPLWLMMFSDGCVADIIYTDFPDKTYSCRGVIYERRSELDCDLFLSSKEFNQVQVITSVDSLLVFIRPTVSELAVFKSHTEELLHV